MTTNTIEIEGLPPGWEVTEMVIHPDDSNDYPEWKQATVKIQKTKPRRIVQIDDYDPSSPNGFD